MTPRIVSLIPSATEIVAALGLGDRLVGRSHECDYPPEVTELPVCSATNLPTAGMTSRQIDDEVRKIIVKGLAMYKVDDDLLFQLQPDLILTQTQCAVCAVTPENVDSALGNWMGSQPPRILSLEPNDLDDLWRDIRNVGAAAGADAAAEHLVATSRARLNAIRQRVAPARRPTVAMIEWIDPLMAGGNWMPELIDIAGGTNLFGEAGQHAPPLDWNMLVAADPEFILLSPCGFRTDRIGTELATLAGKAAWPGLQAVKSGHVYLVDGHRFFNRPGPRLVESAEIVAEILHPDLFDFGHHGDAWLELGELDTATA